MAVDTVVRLTTGDHVVQFYDCDDDLASMVGGYLAASVRDGDAVVVVAIPEHRAAFAAALGAAGIDVETAQTDGALTMLDAAHTLDRFMVGGSPDAERFTDAIGGLITATAARGQQVRVFGEMVAVLWDAGNVAGAIELENLWNGLAEQIPFSLFCAYPTWITADADSVAHVCHLHSAVLDSASTRRQQTTRSFPGTLDTLRIARRFVAQTLQDWGRDDLVQDATLIVSELTTNAVLHAHSDYTVTITGADGRVRVEVTDSSDSPPEPRSASMLEPGGRGLGLVAMIADRWGHDRVNSVNDGGGGGKVVWAELTGH